MPRPSAPAAGGQGGGERTGEVVAAPCGRLWRKVSRGPGAPLGLQGRAGWEPARRRPARPAGSGRTGSRRPGAGGAAGPSAAADREGGRTPCRAPGPRSIRGGGQGEGGLRGGAGPRGGGQAGRQGRRGIRLRGHRDRRCCAGIGGRQGEGAPLRLDGGRGDVDHLAGAQDVHRGASRCQGRKAVRHRVPRWRVPSLAFLLGISTAPSQVSDAADRGPAAAFHGAGPRAGVPTRVGVPSSGSSSSTATLRPLSTGRTRTCVGARSAT